MITLGISGFFNTDSRLIYPTVSPHFFHDAAAALVIDGEVAAAAEQERFDRIKHSNRFPLDAIEACLVESRISIDDVDRIAFFFGEDHTNRDLISEHIVSFPTQVFLPARELVSNIIENRFERNVADSLVFVRHHVAHAASTFFDRPSSEDALIGVIDGAGEDQSISIFVGTGREMRLHREYEKSVSLGHFYGFMTDYLGFGNFSEYKVMGLAAYGDPSVFRNTVRSAVEFQSNGSFSLVPEEIARQLLIAGVPPRQPGAEVTRAHMNVAAAIQDAVTASLLHVLGAAVHETGMRSLCIAGGVGQNSSANGAIASSGIVDHLYVHHAPHDSGAALGAALAADESPQKGVIRKCSRSISPYRGGTLGGGVEQEVAHWSSAIDELRLDQRSAINFLANALSEGQIVAVARGRAEFGPRALGNRSILADPRSGSMRERVNQSVKKRERFRPLAPVVLAELAGDYFEMPDCDASFDYMGVVVRVRDSAQHILQAVTHVDGTARVQILRRSSNPWLYGLISRFGELTGVPVLMNTSFNNHAEPIVQSARDAIQCFLTSDMNVLALEESILIKRPGFLEHLPALRVRLAPRVNLIGVDSVLGRSWRIDTPWGRSIELDDATAEVLRAGDVDVSRGDQHWETMFALWEERVVSVDPARR